MSLDHDGGETKYHVSFSSDLAVGSAGWIVMAAVADVTRPVWMSVSENSRPPASSP